MNADDDEDDRTVIRPPARRTQAPMPAADTSPVPADVPPTTGGHRTGQTIAAQPDVAAAPREATETYARTMAAPPEMRTTAAPAPATPSHSSAHTLTLPAGVRLGEFEVTQTIGEGGFGIVYLAWDHSLQRKVALKEYMPSAIATRVGGTEIRARSERHQETFEAGLKSFINESRLLAQFDHPSLLKVYRFWEANGTAYMVMPFLEGATLRDTVRGLATPPDEAWILSLLAPLFDALTMLHSAQIYHRDIAPDNVLLMADTGRPLLLDFGAARRVIGDMTQALTAILKPGYAPVEQYAEVPGLKQGPWTDVYALAAVVHWMILGKTPSPSVGRMFDDAQVSVADKAAGRYSPRFLQAIDRALAVMPDKRTQTIDAFRQDLTGTGPEPAAAPSASRPATPGGAPQAGDAATLAHSRTTPPTQRTQPTQPTQPATRTVQDERTRHLDATTTLHPTHGDTRAAAATRPNRMPMLIGGALLAVGIAVAAAVLWPKSPAPVPTDPTAAARDAAAAAAASAAAITPATTKATTLPASAATIAATPDAPASAGATAATSQTATPPADPGSTTATTSPRTEADPKPTTRKPPATRTERAETRPDSPRTDSPRVETPRTYPAERPAEARPANDNSAECARLIQRLSIGDADTALMDRYRTLRCR